MFSEMGLPSEDDFAAMEGLFVEWVIPKLESGEYIGWLIVAPTGEIAAGAGAQLQEWSPGFIAPHTHIRPYVMNVYTEHDHRHKGLARALMETILAWGRGIGAPVVTLHASEFGRPLYESMGFKVTNEMRIRIKEVKS
jgi:GNAT superfamily N-acetyltransferase